MFTLTLIAGLAGGLALSYVIYQPQIQGLRNDVNELKQLMADNFTDYQAALDNLNTEIASLKPTENVTSQENTNESTSNTPPVNLQESVGISTLTAAKNDPYFELDFTLVNAGTAPVALDFLYVNGTDQNSVVGLESIEINGLSVAKTDILGIGLAPSATASGKVRLTIGSNFASGDTVTLAFHSLTNKVYQRTVTLP